jgi:hypothetical protein
MKRIGCIVLLAALAAACSSSGGHRASPTTTRPGASTAVTQETSTPRVRVTTACTNADERRSGSVPMPRPVRISKTRVYDHGNDRLDPPPPTARPAASANAIWSAAREYQTRIGSYELVLASYSALAPSRGGVPEFQHLLAWIVVVHHFPGVPGGGSRPLPGATTVPRPDCYFVTVLDVFDAHSGKRLLTIEGA